MDQIATEGADTNALTAGKSGPHHSGPTWPAIFVGGLALWVATVLVTFATQNSNLIPTIILLGSFLVPATFVIYAFSHADPIITPQRIFGAFVVGGILGVLGASLLEAELLKIPSAFTYLWVGLIEEAVKLLKAFPSFIAALSTEGLRAMRAAVFSSRGVRASSTMAGHTTRPRSRD